MWQVNPSYFVSSEALDAIAAATGVTFAPSSRRPGGKSGGEEEEEGEDSEEDVPEEEEVEEERPRFNNRLMNGAAKFL